MKTTWKLVQFLPYMEPCPSGWGLCYIPMNQLGCFIAPVPLNFLVGAWKRLMWYMENGIKPLDVEAEKAFAFEAGRKQGLLERRG